MKDPRARQKDINDGKAPFNIKASICAHFHSRITMFGDCIDVSLNMWSYLPLRRRLHAKIKAPRREVSQLSALQKDVMKKEMPKKYRCHETAVCRQENDLNTNSLRRNID